MEPVNTSFNHDHSFSIGPIRPPSEANSLLLMVTEGCTWNKCRFCSTYTGQQFHILKPDQIKQNIDNMVYFRDLIADCAVPAPGSSPDGRPGTGNTTAGRPGTGYSANGRPGTGNTRTGSRVLSIDKTKLYSRLESLTEDELHCFYMVYNWLSHGGRTVFLQDGNSIALKPEKLADVLHYLKEKFPQIERITTYGRAETLSRWSADQLRLLRDAGLDRIHTGFESGSDNVLKLINKGLTQDQQITGGLHVKEAGMELSVYFMPGIGGLEFSDENARETARVINQIRPDFVRLRTYVLKYDSEMYDLLRTGEFTECTDIQKLREIRSLIAGIDKTPSGPTGTPNPPGTTGTPDTQDTTGNPDTLSSTGNPDQSDNPDSLRTPDRTDIHIVSDHIVNLIGSLSGSIAEDKETLLAQCDRILGLPADEQRLYQLVRRAGLVSDYPDLAALPAVRLDYYRDIVRRTASPDAWESMLSEILRRYV